MDTIIYSAAIGALILITAFLILKRKKNDKVFIENFSGDSSNESQTLPEPVTEMISYEETEKNKQEERLKSLKNPDIDKPFAKISTPNISEIPIEIPNSEGVASKKIVEPIKKKRTYKKKSKDENDSK